ncbi:ABC transporter permease [Candidatus Saccharibacteria bacterium]|nr:ABC transporter permease [Candidatus Saccharibacteria bacterium]
MSLLIRTHLDLAKTSLKERRGRTFLTCLGIAIGVASIILILSLMGSITNLIKSQVEAIGGNLIVIRPNDSKDGISDILTELTSTNHFNKSNLSLTDVTAIQNLNAEKNVDAEFPVTAVAPLAISTNTLVGERTVDSGNVLGTTEELQDLIGLNLRSGTFLRNNTMKSAVIGRDLSLKLFGTMEPVGKTFSLLGERFIITGILSESNSPINFNNVNFDDTVLVNINHLKTLDSNLQIQQINVKVANEDKTPDTAKKIDEILSAAKKGEKNYKVAYGNDISHPAGSLFDIVSGMLTLVAGISLVVGGIGVMNIMLVSVAERTHEIGVRKAVGASNMNIFLQFLFESLILCILGGISGLGLGYVFAFLVSIITPFSPYIDLNICLSALAISIIVGTIFGLYPAVKASRRNPIDSLKSI